MKIARIIEEHKNNYVIKDVAKDIELIATVRGSFFNGNAFPKVGDFVQFDEVSSDKAIIEKIQPRTSTVARYDPETSSEQIIVVNVDIIFIIMGLDNDFNLNRLERYLLLAKKCAIKPVVILNKGDTVENTSHYIEEVGGLAGAVPIYAVSALSGVGMDESFLKHITTDTTAVLLGSSGAGKSTITNWLLKDNKQKTGAVREDDSKGRHTTTSRQLFSLPSGGFLIDTPGMRELSILGATTKNEDATFTLLDTLSRQCEFTKCDHNKTRGCAIVSAIESGDITEKQLQSYNKQLNMLSVKNKKSS